MRTIALALLLSLSQLGCGALPQILQALPQVVKLASGIAESSQLLTLLGGEADAVFPEGAPGEFTQALQSARATLHALQAAQLAEQSGRPADVRRALDAFRAAFVALRMTASRLGIIRPDGSLANIRPSGTSFGGTPVYLFPTPALLQD